MKVILTQEVLGLGDPGEVVDVARGYARNYLLPQKIALEATAKNVAALENERKRIEAQQQKEAEKVRSEAANLNGAQVTLTARAGEGGKLYGSITNMMIAEALATLGFEVDRRRILLENPIKTLGTYQVNIKLHPMVVVPISLVVESEGGAEEVAPEAAQAADAEEEYIEE